MKIHSYLRRHHFPLELIYFLLVASLGFSILRSLDGKTPTFKPRNLDLFFTCVSAATVTSLSTVEMEAFSNTQLVILTILMLIGGEVFTSMLSLYIRAFFFNNNNNIATHDDQMLVLKHKSLRFLSLVVLGYLVSVHVLGLVSVFIYINVITSARDILKQKGLHAVTFSVFTIVSTFSNCGFIPSNENMLVFKKHSGLLLILAPQILLGNTLYPPVLRSLIWVVGMFTKKEESRYLLRSSKGLGYDQYHHLLSFRHSCLLVMTVVGFLMVQFIMFLSMEWRLGSLRDMSVYQKLVGILFQTVNTRHTGESIVDVSTISAAVLVLFIVMMLVTLFIPSHCDHASMVHY